MSKFALLLLLITLSAGAGENDPDLIQKKYQYCTLLKERNAVREATACFKEVVDSTPSFMSAWSDLGVLYEQSRRYPEAVDAFKRVLRHNPDDVFAMGHLIDVLQQTKQHKEALGLAEDAHRRYPHHPGFHVALIKIYQAANRTAEVEALRTELFGLVSRQNFDGLMSQRFYMREIFGIGDATVYAMEYFPTESYRRPRYLFNVKFATRKERTYRLEYHDNLKRIFEAEYGKGAEPYYVDAYDDRGHGAVTGFTREPAYEEVRGVVVKDLTEGRKAFVTCVNAAVSRRSVPCKN